MSVTSLARYLLDEVEKISNIRVDDLDAVEDYHGFMYSLAAACNFADRLRLNYKLMERDEKPALETVVDFTTEKYPELKHFLKLKGCWSIPSNFPQTKKRLQKEVNHFTRGLKDFGFDEDM